MQKLELRQNLNQLIKKTKSKDIIAFFDVNKKINNLYKGQLLRLIIESKEGFDQSIIDEKRSKILIQFNAKKYYETQFFSKIIEFVSNNNFDLPSRFLQQSKQIAEFYTFHNTLITTYSLINNLLFQNTDLRESVEIEDFSEAENEGFLSFEIFSENSIDFGSYSIVVSNINELVKTMTEVIAAIQKIKFEEYPKLILADSGSNTVLSIKLPKEISKSISSIIDDAWQYLTNKTGYNLKKQNQNLGEALGILKQIKKAEKDEVISPEQAEIWKRSLISSTEKIITNNTLTKSKSEEIQIISNQKLLTEATNKYLTNGSK